MPGERWHRLLFEVRPRRSVCGAGRVTISECVMKVRSSVRRITKDCQIVRRKGKVRVINKKNPRYKQVQG
jgi:large subunit ribosomal protein L36